MLWSPSRQLLLGPVLVATVVAGLVAPRPAAAQRLDGGTCPSSVDTGDKGWICALLLLDTPTASPTGVEISRWADRLARTGRQAVAGGIIFSDAAVDAKLASLYRTQLGRDPDPAGSAYWRDRVQSLRSELVAEFGVFNSAEYHARFPSPGSFVDSLYRYYLGRPASGDEQAYWGGLLASGAVGNDGITYAVAVSPEAGAVRAGLLYQIHARRAPDDGGLSYWGGIAAGRGYLGTLVEFASSSEPVQTLGSVGLELAGNDGPPTTPEGCLARLPVDLLVDRIPFLLVGQGADLGDAVDHVGAVGLVGRYDRDGLESIRAQLDSARLTPLLASDEEGGRVQRLSQILGPLPSAASVAALPAADARATYQGYARGMADLGIDLNLAPVLATGDRALGDRSYGDDPAVVTERAGFYVDAMHQAGVLPVLKHFPGLGDASANTDQGTAVGPDLDRLRSHDLVPYQRLVPDGPVAVMMSHLLVPDLTGDTPASLSPAAYALLRDDYGFGGLVVTDSLTANAVVASRTVPEAAVQAVAAGADMTMFSGPGRVDGVHAALRAAVVNGTIPGIRLERAAGAVLGAQGVDPCALLNP